MLQRGDTPLDVAIREHNYGVMHALESAGTKVSRYCVPMYLAYAYTMCSIKFIHSADGTILYGQIYAQQHK